MSKNSALSGPRGVSIGDELTAVDDCTVHGLSDWTECISEVARTQQRGFCLPVTLLHQLDIALHQHGMCLCLSVCLSLCLSVLISYPVNVLLCISGMFVVLPILPISVNIHCSSPITLSLRLTCPKNKTPPGNNSWVAWWLGHRTCDQQVTSSTPGRALLG